MGKIYQTIDQQLTDWLRKQHLFFVATAPSGSGGSINCSPKGGDTFRVLGGSDVAYQDLTGSGVETVAHLRDNGRIVLMFCAFEGPPRIVRLHGRGTAIHRDEAEFAALARHFPAHIGTRSIIRVRLHRISDSCGFAVPTFEFTGNRDTLDRWSENKGEEQLQQYREANNALSIDGLPGLRDDA